MAQAQITYIEIKNHTILEIAVWQNLEVFSVSEPPALQMGMTFVFNIGDLKTVLHNLWLTHISDLYCITEWCGTFKTQTKLYTKSADL